VTKGAVSGSSLDGPLTCELDELRRRPAAGPDYPVQAKEAAHWGTLG
jgi:hypothetical protein